MAFVQRREVCDYEEALSHRRWTKLKQRSQPFSSCAQFSIQNTIVAQVERDKF